MERTRKDPVGLCSASNSSSRRELERERRPLYKYRLWLSAEVHSDSNLRPSSSSVSFLYNSERSSQRIIQSVLLFDLETKKNANSVQSVDFLGHLADGYGCFLGKVPYLRILFARPFRSDQSFAKKKKNGKVNILSAYIPTH